MKTFALLVLPLVGCSFVYGSQIVGSGVARQETRRVGAFSAISHAGVGDVRVVVGPALKVTVKADSNLLSHIRTVSKDGTLRIETDDNLRSKSGITILVSVPSLKSVELSGVGDVDVLGVRGRDFSAKVTGVGDLKAKGSVENISIKLDGVGDAKLDGVNARNGNVTLNGTGDVDVRASSSLEVTLNGVGDVRYRGNPSTTKLRKNGVGDIRKA